MRIGENLHARLAWAWLVALVGVHLLLRVARPDLGPMGDESTGLFFMGLNLPTLALGALLPRNQASWARAFWSARFVLGMGVIALNFAISGALLRGPSDLAGILGLLTAQALWLAWPVYWASRYRARALAGR